MPGIFRQPQFRVSQPWIPTVGAANVTVTVDAGSLVFSGQTVTASLSVPVTAGDLTFTGQTVTPTITAVSLLWIKGYELIHR